MKLIIAEKPSVGRDIASVVKATTKENGYIEGNGYIVTWGIGHLVGEMMPHEYNPQWKKWELDYLPMLPENYGLSVVSGTKQQYQIVESLLKQASEVICATDAGREGELIFRNIYKKSGCKAPVKRLWISSYTNESISDGLQNLKPSKEYDNLGNAARCRSLADWLVGLNATRGYTKIYDTKLTVGRVQTPVLKLIVDRRKAIDDFKTSAYWVGKATYRNTEFEAVKDRFLNIEDAHNWVNDLQGEKLTVDSVDAKPRTEKPPLPFSLTSLQKVMNKRAGWSAANTLENLQELYEKHKLVTYPRTDSNHLTKDLLPDLIISLGSLVHGVDQLENLDLELTHKAFDDSKVEDHHAIIPTTKKADSSSLSSDLELLYRTICTRTIAAFSPDCIKVVTTISCSVTAEIFRASGTVIEQLGWRMVEQDLDKKDVAKIIESFEEGESGDCEIVLDQRKTKAPAEFNEASLLTAMESAGKVLEGDEVLDEMKDQGLGTPATRASVIEGLITNGYIERQSKARVIAAQKGVALISALGDSQITSPSLTGEWEYKLKQIERGELGAGSFMTDVRKFTEKIVADLKATTPEQKTAMEESDSSESLGKCPECEKTVMEFEKVYTCKDRECKFAIWKTIAQKKISSSVVKTILEKGESNEVKGFTSKAKKKFGACLKWNTAEKKIDFIFKDKKAKK